MKKSIDQRLAEITRRVRPTAAVALNALVFSTAAETCSGAGREVPAFTLCHCFVVASRRWDTTGSSPRPGPARWCLFCLRVINSYVHRTHPEKG